MVTLAVTLDEALIAIVIALSGGIGAFITWFSRRFLKSLERTLDIIEKSSERQERQMLDMRAATDAMKLGTAIQAESMLAHNEARKRFTILADGLAPHTAKGRQHAQA